MDRGLRTHKLYHSTRHMDRRLDRKETQRVTPDGRPEVCSDCAKEIMKPRDASPVVLRLSHEAGKE